ncbi:MAG TPA: YafY family protein [Pyrinomonadaceae bacterium]|nr:YafY family protein [Pyrinomonadaceae bacterium]
MRADRLLSILLLLQINRRMTAKELARRLEVSERTIHRDMEALSTAGVPVTSERGSHGGWSLIDGYKTNLTGLAGAEVQALFVPGPSRLLSDLNLGGASESALLKLLAALPEVFRRDAEYVRQRIHVDVTGWNRAEESVPCLHTIQDAVWRGRKLSFEYGQEGCGSERTVDPLGLVAKGSVWYLVASVGGDIRSYRVSRVRGAAVLDEPCMRPEGFDLAAHWEESSQKFRENFPRFYATLRAHPSVVKRMHFARPFARVEEVGEADEEGWPRVRMRFQFAEEACEFALGFGDRVEIVEPAELRDRVLEMAEGVVDFYRRKRGE